MPGFFYGRFPVPASSRACPLPQVRRKSQDGEQPCGSGQAREEAGPENMRFKYFQKIQLKSYIKTGNYPLQDYRFGTIF
ncbi:protein of unknown function [Pseudomonas inefficax]|uniref:Uncharacterized protein n=1 Tax=Pseudomonas inefficax TaxID=2078786 RepID=A0AAQ1P7S8_9PSED|nr:protein of unknown function [Pseudomonas inefficax]